MACLQTYTQTLTVYGQAAAAEMTKLLGRSLLSDLLTVGTITELVEKDETKKFLFENEIVQVLKRENRLQATSDAQQKELLLKREANPKSIIKTIKCLIKAVEKQRKDNAKLVLSGAVQPTPEYNGRQLAAERRKEELEQLATLVEKDLPVKIIPEIVDAITLSIKNGWLTGQIPQYYLQAPKGTDLKAVAAQVAAAMPTPKATNTPRAPRGRGRGRPRGRTRGGGSNYGRRPNYNTAVPALRTQNTQVTSPQVSRKRIPRPASKLHLREQFASHILAVPDAELGERINSTNLKFKDKYCNNFQVWSKCKVFQKNPAYCTFRKRCSLCESQAHGRRTCPNLPDNEKEEEEEQTS